MSILYVNQIYNAGGNGSPALPYGSNSAFQPYLQTASNVVTLAGGYLTAADYKQYATYDGVTYGADISINLKTEVHSGGVTAPIASTAYYLYMRLDTVGGSTTNAIGKTIRPAQKGTSGAFIVLTTLPENADRTTYVPLAVVRTDGTSNYTQFENIPYPFATSTTSSKVIGAGGFATLAAGLATAVAGDTFIVNTSYTTGVTETCAASDITITFSPNVVVTSTATTTIFSLTGNRVQIIRPRWKSTATTTVTNGIAISGTDNDISGAYFELSGSGLVITNLYNISAARNRVVSSFKITTGTVTNSLTDTGTDTDATIRG